jgi:hypothetical protein
VSAVGGQGESPHASSSATCETHHCRHTFSPIGSNTTSLPIPFQNSLLLCNHIRRTAVWIMTGLPRCPNSGGWCFDDVLEAAQWEG